MINILGGSKTGYNLHKYMKKYGIDSKFYFFKNEFGENKKGGYKITDYTPDIENDNIIVSSEKAFVYFNEILRENKKTHYFLRDKSNFPKIASALNINSIMEQNRQSIKFPVFVKPKESGGDKIPFKTKLIRSYEDLNELKDLINDCFLQFYLDPNDYLQLSIAGYFTGNVSSLISVKQLNQYPIGVSSYVEFYENSTILELKKNIADYLRTISFTGFIEFEFKYNYTTREVYIMDINPRPWGWFYYYISAIKNPRDVFLNDVDPILELKKNWINVPRLVLSNLNGRYINPKLKDLINGQTCYEPLF